jgi:predicted TIM-barrel fold metal-dependent hydrolase
MFHPSGGKIGNEIYPYVELASMYGGHCMLHGNPSNTALLARRFPGATFVLHMAEGWDTCASLDNVWFEMVQRPQRGQEWNLPDVINRIGSERIVFGSDLPYYDYRVLQAAIERAPISETEKDRIAYQNAVTLIRRYRPEWQMPKEGVAAPQQYTIEELFEVGNERLLS